MHLNDITEITHAISKDKGFWDEDRNYGEIIALIHSELSEALEELRTHPIPEFVYDTEDEKGELKPNGFFVELADSIIRILDVCGHHGIDMENVILHKLNYNSTRGRKHNKEF